MLVNWPYYREQLLNNYIRKPNSSRRHRQYIKYDFEEERLTVALPQLFIISTSH
jgi:hypothetical protein